MTSEPRFELYSYWRTSATYRVRVACRLKRISVAEHNVDIDRGQQFGPEFLAINPLGAIPALIDRGVGEDHTPKTQSLAILEYLDEIEPRPPLLPPDACGRARVRGIAGMLAADTHPLITPRVRKYLTTEGHFDDAAWRAWQTHWFTTGLNAVERRLSGDTDTGTYCHGEAVSIADICLASILVVMRVFKIDVDGIPTIKRIVATCEALPPFAESEPYAQAGAPIR